MKKTLDSAIISLRNHIHKWPGLLVTSGDGKILVKMRNKLCIYIPPQWDGWPVEVVLENWQE